MTVYLLVAILNVGGELHKIEEVYHTQKECEARGEQIYQSHVEYFEDKPSIPALVVQCWIVEGDDPV